MNLHIPSNCAYTLPDGSELTGGAIRNRIRAKGGAVSGLSGYAMPHILVVDDDPLVCATIEVCLQRKGFEVTVADGGEAGIGALERAAFDVMIVDIFMPHMRGFESIRIFHERAPATPLIAMSGYAFASTASPSPDFLRMALELGAICCLRKPFTPQAVPAAVNECLARPATAARLSK
jgi:CheY-like chemotaxis protein